MTRSHNRHRVRSPSNASTACTTKQPSRVRQVKIIHHTLNARHATAVLDKEILASWTNSWPCSGCNAPCRHVWLPYFRVWAFFSSAPGCWFSWGNPGIVENQDESFRDVETSNRYVPVFGNPPTALYACKPLKKPLCPGALNRSWTFFVCQATSRPSAAIHPGWGWWVGLQARPGSRRHGDHHPKPGYWSIVCNLRMTPFSGIRRAA